MFRDFIILLDSSHDSWGNDGLFVKIAAIVLDVWLHTSSGSRPRCSFCIPEPKVKNVFWDFMILVDSSHDFWENDTLFEKIALWFWTYGLIRLLGTSGPDVVSGSQTPSSRNFLRFHDFIGFISWFLRKWWPVCENCSYGSEHMAWYVFCAQVAQM